MGGRPLRYFKLARGLKWRRVAILGVLAVASILVACDEPKTIEGTVWSNGANGAPAKQAGVPGQQVPARHILRGAL